MRMTTCALLFGAGWLWVVARRGLRAEQTEALEMGSLAFVKGDYDQAISCYTDAIRRDPKEIDAYCIRGLSYGYKGNYDKAFADFDEALRLDPKRGETY